MMERIDFTKIKIIGVGVLLLLFGIFLGMNSTTVEIWIFGWTPGLSLITLMLFAFLFGGGCGYACSVWLRNRNHSDEI